MKTSIFKFHEHLDECAQCRNHPFNLCSEGNDLLQETVYESVAFEISESKKKKKMNKIKIAGGIWYRDGRSSGVICFV